MEIGIPLPQTVKIGIQKEIRISSNRSRYIGFPNQDILHEVQYLDLLEGKIVDQNDQFQNIQDGFGSNHVFIPTENSDEEWLIVGSPQKDIDFFDEGAISIYLNGILQSSIYGTQAGKSIGNEFVLCPDIDGDQIQDTIIGNSHSSLHDLEEGIVYLLPSKSYTETNVEFNDLVFVQGSQRAERFGFSMDCKWINMDVANSEDDGMSQGIKMVIGAPFASNEFETQGRISMYHATDIEKGSLIDLWGIEKDSWLGWDVALGDLNGDGYSEIYAGAPGENDGIGSIYVWDSSLILSEYPTLRILPSIETERFGENFLIEDVDNDGLDDLIIGQKNAENQNGYRSGLVQMIHGQSGSIFETLSVVSRKTTVWDLDIEDAQIGKELGILSIGQKNILVSTMVITE